MEKFVKRRDQKLTHSNLGAKIPKTLRAKICIFFFFSFGTIVIFIQIICEYIDDEIIYMNAC